MITINVVKLFDALHGTSYNHVLARFSRNDLWKMDLQEFPPILDWSMDYGPRVFLFDVCKGRVWYGMDRISERGRGI